MAGQFYRWHPMDKAIFERLPREGTNIGYHILSATVKRITEDMNQDVEDAEGRVTTTEVAARLRSMRSGGLAVNVPTMGSNGVNGWQRTRKGELAYAEKTGRQLGTTPRTAREKGGQHGTQEAR